MDQSKKKINFKSYKMSMIPEHFRKTILEWTNEGNEYLYEEQPERMTLLEQWLYDQELKIDEPIYRRTDWDPILRAQEGDVIKSTRVSSWSRNRMIPDAKYEGIKSVLLILEKTTVKGVDVMEISSYFEEEEVLLAPANFFVEKREGNVLYVKYIHNVLSE